MLAVTGGACAVALAMHAVTPTATAALTLLLAGLAIASCAVIAGQSYVRWRLVGDAVAGRLCVAFAVYGIVVVPLAATRDDGAGGAVGQLLGTAGAAAVLVSTLRGPDVVSHARLGMRTVLLGGTAAAATVMVCALPAAERTLADLTVAGQPMLEVGGALAVVVGAGFAAAAGARLARRSLTSSATALALLAVVPAVASAGPTPPSAHLLAAAVQAAALALVVPVTVADTRLALRAVGRDNATLRERWHDAVTQIDGISRYEAERTHELRSALLALEGASDVLRRHVEHRGAPEDAALAAALASELTRLHGLVTRLPSRPRTVFAVREALLPVVLARRACGQVIALDVEPHVTAMGRPEALAEAVGNLLANSAVHAAGAHVRISAHVGEQVSIVVEDDGPGFGSTEPVARPYVVGGASARQPHGLGLLVASRLVADDGGSLTVLRDPWRSGAAVSITLPRPRTAEDETWPATAS